MAAGGARTAPLRFGGAVCVLDKIEKIITHPSHFFHGNVLTLPEDASLACKTDIERFCRKVFTELQVLKKSHSLSAAIIPWPPAFLPMRERTNREFPIVSCVNCARLDDTATGKANETGFEISDHLSNVGAQTVR